MTLTLYELREQPWRDTLKLGAEGIAAYALDIPEESEIDSDKPLRVFVPIIAVDNWS